jgi:hypothetical protein
MTGKGLSSNTSTPLSTGSMRNPSSDRLLSFRLQGEIFPLSFAFNDLTTRSLTGVYAEFTEALDMQAFLGSLVLSAAEGLLHCTRAEPCPEDRSGSIQYQDKEDRTKGNEAREKLCFEAISSLSHRIRFRHQLNRVEIDQNTSIL